QTQVSGMERKFPTEVLIGLNRDQAELHDVYRLDLVTGELTKEVENPGFIGWVADAQLAVRATVAPQPDGSLVLLVRDSAEADWRPLLKIGRASCRERGESAVGGGACEKRRERGEGGESGSKDWRKAGRR